MKTNSFTSAGSNEITWGETMRSKIRTKTVFTATLWAAVMIFVLLTTVVANAKPKTRTSADLDTLASKMQKNKMVSVLIQYYTPPDRSSDAKVRMAAPELGAPKFRHEFRKLHMRHYEIPVGALTRLLAADPNIRYITPDRSLAASMDTSVQTVGADIALSLGYDGDGVGVAVIDSGVADNLDLATSDQSASRVVYRQNFVGTEDTSDDLYGHGTHVAGIIGGNGASSSCPTCTKTLHGIAPKVNIVSLRVLGSDGAGTDSMLITALQRAVELKDAYNVRVINMSVGRGIYESYVDDPLCQAVEQAWKAGIVVVVAAGNNGRDNTDNSNGYGSLNAPANDPYVITVGAMRTKDTAAREDDEVATFSSKGPSRGDLVVKPDIIAPGNQIISLAAPNSTIDTAYPGNIVPRTYFDPTAAADQPSNYFRMSGTSMSTPMVAGAAALLVQQNPAITPDQVKARLMKTAWKGFIPYSTWTDDTGATRTIQSDIFTVGAGYLDVAAALADTETIDSAVGLAQSPTVVFDSTLGQAYLSFNSSTLWAGSPDWSASTVWGNAVISGITDTGLSTVWGITMTSTVSDTGATSITWGTAAFDSVTWGTSLLESVTWGTSFLELESITWGTNWFMDSEGQAYDALSITWGTLIAGTGDRF